MNPVASEYLSKIFNVSKLRKPLVAVRCVAFNQKNYIKKCLDGILKQQTNFPFIAIVHDDASTDGTAEIIKQYAEKFPGFIMPVLEKENQYSKSVYSLRNIMDEAEKLSKAKYIAWCDGDDYWTDPLKLQRQFDFMESHPEYSLCFHNADYFKQSIGKIVGSFNRYPQDCEVPVEDIIKGGGGFCPSCSLFYRAELVKDIPEFARKFQVCDYPLQIFLASKGKVYYFADIMGVYRIAHPGSWSCTISANRSHAAQYRRLLKSIEFLKEFNNFTKYKFHSAFEERINSNCCDVLIPNGVRRRIDLANPRSHKEQLDFYIVKFGLFPFKIWFYKYIFAPVFKRK